MGKSSHELSLSSIPPIHSHNTVSCLRLIISLGKAWDAPKSQFKVIKKDKRPQFRAQPRELGGLAAKALVLPAIKP